ncbi:hypothetical protein Xvie_02639 [Xenorhabdus vietnamensis]|uniref:Uncharacterized protein n=1 Tax=Xenorhabdus vietnamensis TaxID=351656 RepID=A0A1Y2SA48_9GAMM|nr:hypothetical protein Xvie_02639 [Xenorhabdus vietnamensis]
MPDHFLTPRYARSQGASKAKCITIMKRYLKCKSISDIGIKLYKKEDINEPIIHFINDFLPKLKEWYLITFNDSDQCYQYRIIENNSEVIPLLINTLNRNSHNKEIIHIIVIYQSVNINLLCFNDPK